MIEAPSKQNVVVTHFEAAAITSTHQRGINHSRLRATMDFEMNSRSTR
jgi:hypothetical protein